MSRRSPYWIELAPDERSDLERRARRQTATKREVIRAQVVVLAAEGLRTDEIAERLGTVRTTVSRWRKRFFEDRDSGLRDRPRSGRPKVYSPSVVVEIKALTCERPLDPWVAPRSAPGVLNIEHVFVARPTGFERPDAISIRIPVDGADDWRSGNFGSA